MLPVLCGIPKPSSSVRATLSGRRKYPFAELEVGDMFFVPDRIKNNLSTLASLTGKKLGRQFSSRLLYMVETIGEVDASTEGAVLGIGVWRDK
jgi:hypothetical protein